MKNLFLTVVVLLFTSLVFISCEKREDDSFEPEEFEINIDDKEGIFQSIDKETGVRPGSQK